MMVHSFSPGVANKLYLPAGNVLPSTIISLLVSKVVIWFAPALHIFPYGSRAPVLLKIFRPRTEGAPYQILICAPATSPIVLSRGLGMGLVWAKTMDDRKRAHANKQAAFN